jgi:hypothetical protein
MASACMLRILLPLLPQLILRCRYKWPDEEYRGQWVMGHMQVVTTCGALAGWSPASPLAAAYRAVLQGLGVLIMRDGSRYVGEFVQDKFCGSGRLETTDGEASALN